MTSRDRAALLLLAAVLAAALGSAWPPGRTLFARDLTYVFHPMNVWTAENLQAGRLPLWNPYVSGGVPWLGQPQTGVFYPGNAVFWLFPFVGALKLFHACHFFLSALGGYLWARAAGGSRGKAVLAGLLWSLNGFWRARAEFPPLLAVLSWTPWLALFLRRGAAWPLAGTGALAVAAGYWPQVVWSGVLAWVAAGRRRTATALTAVVPAAALSAAALFPGLELAFRSARADGGLGGAADAHALLPADWLGLAWPWASRAPEAAYTGEKFFWLGCFYVGVVGLCLAGRALMGLDWRRRAAWGALILAGAVLSVGDASPAFPFLNAHVPPFSWVRYPAQFAFWLTASAAALATAHGPRRPAWGAALVIAAAAELWVYGHRLAPHADDGFFRRRPAWAADVQARDGRFFLTPRAASDMRAEGRDAAEAWARLREKGLNLTPLPYHVRSLNPYGFALNPAATERLLASVYGAPSFDAARPDLERLGVRWVASPVPLAAPGLSLRGEGPWRLYELADVRPAAPMWDPGWTAYVGGRRARVVEDRGLLAVPEAGDAAPRLLFRPAAVFAGVLLSAAAWVFLAARGLRCL